MAKSEHPPLGPCPRCGINRDIPGVGVAHRCIVCDPATPPRKPVNLMMNPEPDELPKRRVKKKLSPMEHPEGEPIVGAKLSTVAELQAKADAVPAKKGRPKIRTDEEKREAARERMRKKRAEGK